MEQSLCSCFASGPSFLILRGYLMPSCSWSKFHWSQNFVESVKWWDELKCNKPFTFVSVSVDVLVVGDYEYENKIDIFDDVFFPWRVVPYQVFMDTFWNFKCQKWKKICSSRTLQATQFELAAWTVDSPQKNTSLFFSDHITLPVLSSILLLVQLAIRDHHSVVSWVFSRQLEEVASFSHATSSSSSQ